MAQNVSNHQKLNHFKSSPRSYVLQLFTFLASNMFSTIPIISHHSPPFLEKNQLFPQKKTLFPPNKTRKKHFSHPFTPLFPLKNEKTQLLPRAGLRPHHPSTSSAGSAGTGAATVTATATEGSGSRVELARLSLGFLAEI